MFCSLLGMSDAFFVFGNAVIAAIPTVLEWVIIMFGKTEDEDVAAVGSSTRIVTGGGGGVGVAGGSGGAAAVVVVANNPLRKNSSLDNT